MCYNSHSLDRLLLSEEIKNKLNLHSLIKNASIYTSSELFKKVLPFLLLPFFTSILTEEDFGIWGVFLSISSGLAPLIGISSNASLSRHYWDLDLNELRDYIGDIFKLIFSVFLILLIGLLIYNLFYKSFFRVSIEVLLYSLIMGFITILITIPLLLMQLKKDAIQYSIYSVLNAFSATIFSFFMVYIIGGWRGYIIGYIFGSAIICLLLFKQTVSIFKINFLKYSGYFKKIISYGSSYLLAAFSVWIIDLSDRLFISNMVGLSETGIYVVGYSFGSIMLVINTSISRSWIPFFYNNIEDKTNQQLIVKAMYIYWLFLLIGALALSYLSPFALKVIVDEKFFGASIYISWVSFGYAFNGMSKSLEAYLHYLNLPELISKIQLTIAVINVALNFLLIIKNGALGAAQATLITYFVGFLLTIIIVNNKFKISWLFKNELPVK